MNYVTIQIISVASNVVRLDVIFFMVVEINVGYLTVSADDGREFHTDRGNPGHSCTSLLTRMGVL